jgi:hypothetical protein
MALPSPPAGFSVGGFAQHCGLAIELSYYGVPNISCTTVECGCAREEIRDEQSRGRRGVKSGVKWGEGDRLASE